MRVTVTPYPSGHGDRHDATDLRPHRPRGPRHRRGPWHGARHRAHAGAPRSARGGQRLLRRACRGRGAPVGRRGPASDRRARRHHARRRARAHRHARAGDLRRHRPPDQQRRRAPRHGDQPAQVQGSGRCRLRAAVGPQPARDHRTCPAGAAAHGRAWLRAHRDRQFRVLARGHRLRADQLRRRQGCSTGIHAAARARSRPQGRDRQCAVAGHNEQLRLRGTGQGHRRRSCRHAGRRRRRGGLPGVERSQLDYGPDAAAQRRRACLRRITGLPVQTALAACRRRSIRQRREPSGRPGGARRAARPAGRGRRPAGTCRRWRR